MVRPRESLTEWPRVMWTVRRLPWVMGPGSHSWWSWCKQHGSAQLRTTSAKESLSVWREIPEKFHFVWVHMQADAMTPEESETIWGLRPNSGYLNQSHLFSQSCKHGWRLVASPVTISDFFLPFQSLPLFQAKGDCLSEGWVQRAGITDTCDHKILHKLYF